MFDTTPSLTAGCSVGDDPPHCVAYTPVALVSSNLLVQAVGAFNFGADTMDFVGETNVGLGLAGLALRRD